MYHFQESIQDTKGNALTGYYLKAVDTVTGDLVSLWSDSSGTPIVSVSGLSDAAKVDSDGMAGFWIDSGTYHVDIYATDGVTLIRRETDWQMIEPLTQDTADDRYVLATDFETTIQALTQNTNLNNVVSGCGWAYTTGLTFSLSAGSAYIDGTLVDVTAQTVTLDAADGSLPRVDILYIDDTGVFGKITGTPASNPSQPSYDPTTQLYLTFVLVPAAAASLSGITTETIYDEGVEWAATATGSGFTIGSTNNPNSGTKDIEATAVTTGSYVKFVRSSAESFDGDGSLLISIRSKATWNSKRSLTLFWRSSNVTVGNVVAIKNGSYGFDSSNTGSYQKLVIPKSAFAVPAGSTVDELRVSTAGTAGTAISFYIDPIQIQNTNGNVGGSQGYITQTDADARYLKAASNLSDLGSKVTARTNLGATTVGGNLFTLTNPSAVTFFRVNADNTVSALSASAFRTAIGAGTGTGTGDMLSTNNLSDVANVATARTNLGLGSAALLASSAVCQTANNLSDLASASTARTNLGVAIGSNVQAWSTKLDAIAANTVTTDSTTARTAAIADADTFIRFTSGSAVTFTIPPNSSVAFPVGTVIEFSQSGAGAVSVAAGSGVTVNSRSSDLTLAGQYAVAFVKKVATDTWLLNGDL